MPHSTVSFEYYNETFLCKVVEASEHKKSDTKLLVLKVDGADDDPRCGKPTTWPNKSLTFIAPPQWYDEEWRKDGKECGRCFHWLSDADVFCPGCKRHRIHPMLRGRTPETFGRDYTGQDESEEDNDDEEEDV